MLSFLDKYVRRESCDQMIGLGNLQIKLLCDVVTDKLLMQMVLEKTRLDNLLDLVFVNNESSILSIKVLHNVGLLDHNLYLVSMNIIALLDSSVEDDFPYFTSIPKYCLLEATDDDWSKLNNFFRNVDWLSLFEGH